MKKSVTNKKKTPSIAEKNRSIRNRVLILLSSFALQLVIYLGLLFLGTVISKLFYTVGFTVYLTAGAVILVAYYILNGATFSNVSPDVRKIDSEYADRLEVNRKKAKRLLYILLPMAVLLLIVFTDMYFGEALRSLFR